MHTFWWICLFSYHFLHFLSILEHYKCHFHHESPCQELLKQLISSHLLAWIFLSFLTVVCFVLPASFIFFVTHDYLPQNFCVSLKVQRVRLFYCKISTVKVPSLASALWYAQILTSGPLPVHWKSPRLIYLQATLIKF